MIQRGWRWGHFSTTHSESGRSWQIMTSKARLGCALTIPAGHEIERETAFSAIDFVSSLNCGSLSHQILINYFFFLLPSEENE